MKTHTHRYGSALRAQLLCLMSASLMSIGVGCNAKIEVNHREDGAATETIVRLNDEVWSESNKLDDVLQHSNKESIETLTLIAHASESVATAVEKEDKFQEDKVQSDKAAEVTPESFEAEVSAQENVVVQESATDEAKPELPSAEEVDLASENKLLPQDRPDWVAAPDSYAGEIHTLVVTTPTGNSIKECETKFAEVAYQRFVAYAKDKLEIDVTKVPKVTKEWVADHTLTSGDRFFVDRTVDGAVTYSGWTKLIIGPDTRSDVQKFHRQSQWLDRSGSVGTLFLGMILCFGVAHVGLQLFSGKQTPG